MGVARVTLVPLLLLVTIAGCSKGEKKASEQGPQTEQAKPAEAERKYGLTEAEAAQILAKVGDTEITLGQFAERLGSQSPYLRARYNSPERREEFLDNMVRFELLAIEAKKRGHDQRPEVQRVERQMMVQQMMKEMFDEKGVKLSDISDADIKAYYDANVGEFNKPAERRASHILRKDRASAQKLLDQLKAKHGDMGLFRQLAKDKNEDADTKQRFGDLRFFPAEPAEGEAAPPKAVRDAIFSLEKTGDLYPEVVESEQGFHVLKLTGQRAALERSLEDARRLIQNRLWRERREAAIDAFVTELRSKANIQEDLAALDQVKIDLTAPGPEGQQAQDLDSLESPHDAAHDRGGDEDVDYDGDESGGAAHPKPAAPQKPAALQKPAAEAAP